MTPPSPPVPLLSIRGLRTYFDTEAGVARAVDGVDLPSQHERQQVGVRRRLRRDHNRQRAIVGANRRLQGVVQFRPRAFDLAELVVELARDAGALLERCSPPLSLRPVRGRSGGTGLLDTMLALMAKEKTRDPSSN